MNIYKYWQDIEGIIDEALELEEEYRESFIKKNCSHNPELLGEALDYYTFIKKAESLNFLDTEFNQVSELLEDPEISADKEILENVIGTSIGPYKITELIGEGGMGSVYLAKRIDGEFNQKVALKFLRGGFFSSYLRKRFINEKRILAKLNHPNITRMLDGGIADHGTPYLTMEYVDGFPVDEYCSNLNLNINERLKLFLQICDAVQYAHSNLIIHRDLKPQNILVTAEGRVKIMDFGIAKFMQHEENKNSTRNTREGELAVSVECAAPEQFVNETSTMATDIYGLGALLYLLLTGEHSLPVENSSISEAKSMITHDTPPKPSQKSKKNIGPIAGDLDAIIMKALRKNPGRRYGSAEMMADDIKRYQHGLPVNARQATFGYRTGKFIRRNRSKIVAALLLIAGLFGIIMHYTTQLAAERDIAQLEAERSEAVKGFLVEVFQTANPEVNRGEQITANEMLNRGVEMAAGLASQPGLQIDMLGVAGEIYRSLGDYDSAFEVTENALSQAQELYGQEHEIVAGLLNSMGIVLKNQGDYTTAEQYALEALEQQRRLLGNKHPDVAVSKSNLGNILCHSGDHASAVDLIREALEIQRPVLGDLNLDVAQSLTCLGISLRRLGEYEEALAVHEEALEIRRSVLGDLHPDVASSLNSLGISLRRLGEYEQARAMHEEALEIRRAVLGDNHPSVATSLNNLGIVLRNFGEYEQARVMYEQALDIERSVLGDDHPSIAISLNNLGNVLRNLGEHEKARALYKQALEIRRSALGNDHPSVATSLNSLGVLLHASGEYEQSRAVHEEALEIRRFELGNNHPSVATSLSNLGVALRDARHLTQARSALEKAVELRRELSGEEHPSFAISLTHLAHTIQLKGDYERAEELLLQALNIQQEALPEGHWRKAATQSLLGVSFAARGEFSEAENLLNEGYRILASVRGPHDHNTQRAKDRLEKFNQNFAERL